MNLRELNYVIAVAKHKHFGRASEACFVSQPTLSAQIKKLENELGIILFERNNKRVFLTHAGKILIKKMKSVIELTDDIFKTAHHLHSPDSISVKLALIPTLGPYLLPKVLPTIKNEFKTLKLNLYEDQTHVILKKLNEGELDAVILALPIETDGLTCTPLFSEDFLLALPKKHKLADKRRVDVKSLARDELMLLAEGHCLRNQALDVCHLQNNSDYHATSLETLYQMVASGHGVTVLPKLAAYSRSNIVLKPMNNHAKRDIVMLWRKEHVYNDVFAALAQVISRSAKQALAKDI